MKIVVTGSAGFIGSHLAWRLLQRGDEVVGVDNFNDYYDPNRKWANSAELLAHPQFRLIEADIRDRQRILALFEEEKFEAVVHLAAMAGVRNSIKDPLLYIEVDLNGTQHLLDGARFNGIQNFVFASSSSVYGETAQIPFSENDPCDRPLQPYAAAKRSAEMLGYSYHHLFKLNFTALRFFTVYGPRNRPDMMAYLLAESITKGQQIPLFNGGEMYRDWTYIDDIVQGIIQAVDHPLGYEIINLGRGEPVLLKEFIETMEGLAGRRGNFIEQPRNSADVPLTYADITKAQRLLNYQPQTSVRDGVASFWQWYLHKKC